MIQELFDFITQRWDFLLPLIYEHLQISAIAIVFATIVGVSIGILIAEKSKGFFSDTWNHQLSVYDSFYFHAGLSDSGNRDR